MEGAKNNILLHMPTLENNQGMYKNRVKNNRNFFEIPTLLSCEQGNPAENRVGKFKIYMLF